MENWNIVGILGTGLSGLGFLLMFLAYKLIQGLVPLPNVNPLIIKTINRYMLVCFLMTIAVGAFTFITGFYKKDVISQQSEKIAADTQTIGLLAASNKNNQITDSILISIQKPGEKTLDRAVSDQNTFLDSLSQVVNQQTGNPKITDDFNRYKKLLVSTSDSLTKETLTKEQSDSLKINFIKYRRSISDLLVKSAEAQQKTAP